MLLSYSKAYNLMYSRKWIKSYAIAGFSIISDLNFICVLLIKQPLWNSGHRALMFCIKEVMKNEREYGQYFRIKDSFNNAYF